MSDFPHQDLCGWVPDFPTRPAVAAALGPPLARVAPHLFGGVGDDDLRPTLLFKAWSDVLGKEPEYPAQKIGDCCSFGSAHAVDLEQCVQIAVGKRAESYKEICSEAIYGMGREVAGMLGGADGCFGSAVAKAVTQGVVPREAVGPYDGGRAKQWGARGVPADVKAKAADHKVQSTAAVTTTDEARAALRNGYPFIVCSNQGFAMERDQDGVCRPQGHWAHCLHCCGCRSKDGRWQFCIGQSWGPGVPSGPTTDGQPSFSFWIEESPMASMLSGRDSFAFSTFQGFPGQPLPSAWSYSDFI